jgi:predicted transcriptional regulator
MSNEIPAGINRQHIIDAIHDLYVGSPRGPKDGFVEVLRDARFFVGSNDLELLNTAAQLRNFLIHDPKRPYDYVAVPTSAIVDRMKQIAERLLHPELVTARFRTPVETVAPDETLASVLERIAKSDFSQFPVYSDKIFKGLLTENGITRWFAHQVIEESLVETREVLVRHVVREEEKRADCDFVPRNESIDQVRRRFAENKLLEAVLITDAGGRNQKLLGIITRWDRLER